jgi:outer membrane PBP1 activator LpoA protein
MAIRDIADPEQTGALSITAVSGRSRTTDLPKHREPNMKKFTALFVAAGVAALTACNSSPKEEAADNIQENAEAVADNLEEAADNASTDAAADSLENQADAVRDQGDAKAKDLTTNDPDTNLANGM